jgi:hypothetical protein
LLFITTIARRCQRRQGNDFWVGNPACHGGHGDCGVLPVRVAVGNQKRGINMNETELSEWLEKRGYILRCYRKLKNKTYISWALKNGDLKGQLWISIPIEELPQNHKFMQTFNQIFSTEVRG